MNKEQVLDCYLNALADTKLVSNLSHKFSLFFSNSKIMPENFRPQSSTITASQSRMTSEMDETLSFYTALSRLTIDQSLLDDVQTNHKNHSPFRAIDEDKDEMFRWYYQQRDGSIFGPLFSHEMDSRYQLGKFGKATRVKTREDDSYYPFINILKRYCKILKTQKLNLIEMPKKLSNKIKKFKKGEVMKKKGQWGKNVVPGDFQESVKETRTRTYAPRPVFDLNLLLEKSKNVDKIEDDEEEDLDVPPEGRERAKTQV